MSMAASWPGGIRAGIDFEHVNGYAVKKNDLSINDDFNKCVVIGPRITNSALAHSLGGLPAYLGGPTDPAKRLDESDLDRLLKTQYDKAEFQYDWTVNAPQQKRLKETTP
jgi:hypothetical protein